MSWLWWTAPRQIREQLYCSAIHMLTAAQRAQGAMTRRADQVERGVLYGERKAEDSNPNA